MANIYISCLLKFFYFMPNPKNSMNQIQKMANVMFAWAAEGIDLPFVRKNLSESGISMIYKNYISMMLFTLSVSMLVIMPFALMLIPYSILYSLWAVFSFPSAIFIGFYYYPYYRKNSRIKMIEVDMPFILNHMSAIANSGVPPYMMFRLLSKFKEYEGVSPDFRKIVRNTDLFGMDISTAIKEVVSRTPSKDFKELLQGIVSIIETGGDLKSYLEIQSQKAMFLYRLQREKYIDTLSLYADFYTALLIAAPMFMVAILSILSMMPGGNIAGLDMSFVVMVSVYMLIPLLNIAFIGFVHMTQPKS